MATTQKRGSVGKKSSKKAGQQSAKKAQKSASRKRGGAKGQQKEPQSPMPAQHQAKPGIESEITPKPQYEAPLYKGSGKLEGKVALITGGDSGIGRAVAVLFAREGADIVIVYLPAEETDAHETRRAVEKEGRMALLLSGDVRESRFCRNAVEWTVQEMGRLDILVNNAAFQQHQKSLEDVTEEQFDKTFKTNIYGYFFMAKAALEYLPKGGSIINTGSITGLQGSRELLDYSATKARFTLSPNRSRRTWSNAAYVSTASRPAPSGLRSTLRTKSRRM